MIAAIPLVLTGTITVILLINSKKNQTYIKQVGNLDKSQYPFRDIMPIGLYYADKFGIEKFKESNKLLYEKMVSIYGLETEEFFRLHIANKIILGILSINAVYFLMLANGSFSIYMIIMGIIAGIAAYFLADSMQEEQFKKRSNQIKYDFPEFLTKLVLLINAGLSFERAWEKIMEESSDSESPLIYELSKTYKDMKSNIPRIKCLNDLSRRCKVKEINKFTSIVLQNINKGSSDMVYMLQQLSDECWNERKNIAKQKGEEASSKLLFPMMLMLIAVFVVVLAPAMMQMLSI